MYYSSQQACPWGSPPTIRALQRIIQLRTIVLQNATQPGNVTRDENETVAATAAGLKFIWSVTGIEADQIIMVLDQDGTDLFGRAKYEPQTGNPWNGEVTGSVSGDKVDLTVTAQKDNELVSSKLSGTFDELNGTINGNFTQVSQGKIMNKGSFTAIQISPDTSSYTPATIEQPKAAAAPAPAVAETTTPEATDTQRDSRGGKAQIKVR